MTPLLVALAVLVALGGIVAVSAREPRFAVLGVIIVLVGGAYVADPLPGSWASGRGLPARCSPDTCSGSRCAMRPRPTAGWHVGWPGATALAAVAFAAGWFAAGIARDGARGHRRARGRRPPGSRPRWSPGRRSPGRRSPPRSRWSRWARRPSSWRATSSGSASASCCSSPRPASSAMRWRPATTGAIELAFAIVEAIARCRHRGARRRVDPAALRPRAPRLGARQPAIHHRALDEAHWRPAPGDDQRP